MVQSYTNRWSRDLRTIGPESHESLVQRYKKSQNESMVIARSFRRNFIALAGRLVNRSGKITLRTPARWPWAKSFMKALITLRALEPVPI